MFKGTVSAISSVTEFNDEMLDSQRYPKKLCLINWYNIEKWLVYSVQKKYNT